MDEARIQSLILSSHEFYVLHEVLRKVHFIFVSLVVPRAMLRLVVALELLDEGLLSLGLLDEKHPLFQMLQVLFLLQLRQVELLNSDSLPDALEDPGV